MNSVAMLLFLIPVVFGAGALFLGLALAAVATGMSESYEEGWDASEPAGRVSIPLIPRSDPATTRAA